MFNIHKCLTHWGSRLKRDPEILPSFFCFIADVNWCYGPIPPPNVLECEKALEPRKEKKIGIFTSALCFNVIWGI